MDKNKLFIIVAGNNPISQDAYSARKGWEQYRYYWLREIYGGKTVEYNYLQMLDESGDIVRARVVGKEGVEKIAYIHGVNPEDTDLNARLNRILRIRLKKVKRKT